MKTYKDDVEVVEFIKTWMSFMGGIMEKDPNAQEFYAIGAEANKKKKEAEEEAKNRQELAEQQKQYYEEWKKPIYGTAKHCRECRRKRRDAKEMQRKKSEELKHK